MSALPFDRLNAYFDQLVGLGYRPQYDDDGDLVFRHGDFRIGISVDDEDPQFLLVFIQNFHACGTQSMQRVACELMADLNRRYRIAKFSRRRHEVWVSAELLLTRPEDFGPALPRLAELLGTAASTFRRELRERMREIEHFDHALSAAAGLMLLH